MVLKITGCILIVLSTSCIGILAGFNLMRQTEALTEIRNTAVRIKNEMTFYRTPMPELLEAVAEKSQNTISSLLLAIASELKEYGGNDFFSVWSRNCSLYAAGHGLKKCGEEQLISLGRHLTGSTSESGKSSLDGFITEIQLVIDENSLGLKDKIKLYRNLGILAGIFCVVMIL